MQPAKGFTELSVPIKRVFKEQELLAGVDSVKMPALGLRSLSEDKVDTSLAASALCLSSEKRSVVVSMECIANNSTGKLARKFGVSSQVWDAEKQRELKELEEQGFLEVDDDQINNLDEIYSNYQDRL